VVSDSEEEGLSGSGAGATAGGVCGEQPSSREAVIAAVEEWYQTKAPSQLGFEAGVYRMQVLEAFRHASEWSVKYQTDPPILVNSLIQVYVLRFKFSRSDRTSTAQWRVATVNEDGVSGDPEHTQLVSSPREPDEPPPTRLLSDDYSGRGTDEGAGPRGSAASPVAAEPVPLTPAAPAAAAAAAAAASAAAAAADSAAADRPRLSTLARSTVGSHVALLRSSHPPDAVTVSSPAAAPAPAPAPAVAPPAPLPPTSTTTVAVNRRLSSRISEQKEREKQEALRVLPAAVSPVAVRSRKREAGWRLGGESSWVPSSPCSGEEYDWIDGETLTRLRESAEVARRSRWLERIERHSATQGQCAEADSTVMTQVQ